ncbi:MAG: DUF3617 family protein [Burkholderiales bacterium]|nr:DUF3617 family protein [Burkholderiales bacterium]
MNIFVFLGRTALALSGILLAVPAAAFNFNDGNWHVTVTTEISGMQVRPPPPYYYTRCFTKRSFQPHLAPPGAPCRASNLRTHKDVMTWNLTCAESVAQMSGHGRMVFGGNRVTGTVTTVSRYPAEMQVVQKISGKRVGPCDVQGDPIEGRPLRPPLREYQETAPRS